MMAKRPLTNEDMLRTIASVKPEDLPELPPFPEDPKQVFGPAETSSEGGEAVGAQSGESQTVGGVPITFTEGDGSGGGSTEELLKELIRLVDDLPEAMFDRFTAN